MSGSALSDLSGLLALSRRSDLDLRPVILRVQTDLFVAAGHRDPASIAAFEALAGGLLPAVDDDTAAVVARKLAPVRDAPESILALLAARGGEARRAVVERAPSLPAAVAAAALCDGADLSTMRAARPDLGRDEVAELVSRADPAVDIGLARNAAIGLSGAALETLVGRAREDAELAEALLCRADLPPAHAAALYLSAAEAQRAEIRAGVETIATLRRSTLPLPAREACDALVDLAMAGDQERFSSRLAAVLGLGGTIEWGFGGKARHDLLPLALLAVGFGEEDAVRIILTLEPTIAFSVQEVFRLVRLFRQTPRPTAAYLIEAVLGGEARRPAARHLPHMQPGGTTSRAGAREAMPDRAATPDPTRLPRRA
jgi:hypothetical protein